MKRYTTKLCRQRLNESYLIFGPALMPTYSTKLCRPRLNESYSIFGLALLKRNSEKVHAKAERVVLDLRDGVDAEVLYEAV